MHVLGRPFVYLVASTLLAGCASPWPQNLPPTRYTGVVINVARNGIPEPGATVSAVRPGMRGFGMFTDETLASTSSDRQGHFVLQTRSGYATNLNVSSSDERLSGSRYVGQSGNNIVLPINPSFKYIGYQPDVDPNSLRAKQADKAMHQIAVYISAHPHDQLQSLRIYTKLGVISSTQLACFTTSPDWFFGRNPRVEYGWGKQVIIFPGAGQPITFGQPSFPMSPRNQPKQSSKARQTLLS